MFILITLSLSLAFAINTTTPAVDYYEAPVDQVNYDDDIIALITKKYNKLVRPVANLNLSLRISMRQLISIDEKNQIMTSSFYLTCQWIDGRLKWNPSKTYGNLTEIVLPATSIWTPDLFVINTASATGFITVSSSNLALVNNQGYVYLIVSVTNLQTRCKMNVYYFPFDKQICSIMIGSWQHDTTRINFDSDSSKIDLSNYVAHPVWSLKAVTVKSVNNSDRYLTTSGYTNEDIYYYLSITRGSSYYMSNLIACFILNVVTVLAFFIPFAQQVALCMTAFLTFAVQSLNIANFLPVQSLYFPLISVYFICSIFVTFLSMFWFWLVNYYTTKNYVPKCLEIIATGVKRYFICIYHKPVVAIKNETVVKETNNSITLESSKVSKSEQKIDCNKCEMCTKCKESKEKDDTKKKVKENNDSALQALNYLMCFIVIFLLVCIITIVWLINALN